MLTKTRRLPRRPDQISFDRLLPALSIIALVVGAGASLAVSVAVGSSGGTSALLAVDDQPIVPTTSVETVTEAAQAPAGAIAQRTPEITTSEIDLAIDPNTIAYFDGRAIRPVKTIRMEVTAYSPDARSCAPFDDGITASGYSVWTNGMKLIAADKRFPFGTLLSVPGYNQSRPTPVLDRGGAIKGDRLDVLYPTHERARQWGRQHVDVTMWEYVDAQTG